MPAKTGPQAISGCPGREDLAAFSVGKLPPELREEVAAHIEGCGVCLAALQALEDASDPDPFMAGFRKPVPPDLEEFLPLHEAFPSAPVAHSPPVDTAGPDVTPNAQNDPVQAQTPLPGAPVRLGRYQITSKLGAGSFGVVYRGYDADLQRDVAIKIPHRHRVARPEDILAYLTEARVLANLDHPNIVPVHDFGRTDDGLCFVVSKFIEGSDLAKRIEEALPSFTESAGFVDTVAEALHYAHRRGLVHRDIKPSNLLLDKTGKPYVADFGLALKEEDFGKGAAFAGTPAYMSPEQARVEGHRVDGRSDIFSLGVVFYELLTGRHPFQAETRSELLVRITTLEPRPLRQINDTIPDELERICLKALSKRASDRYRTAKDMAHDLRHWQAGDKSRASVHVQVMNQPAINVQVVVPAAGTATPGSGAPFLPPTTPAPDQLAIKIVPKGLRSFDATDADFFLELLPGPRDRNGLPDSIRFWKSKIEEPDADKTFAVGLLYGPSGCGKSSLVKAGLLPRLADHVIAVYLEATPLDTESRLLKGLRKHCPELAAGLGLAEAIAALRRGRALPGGKKALIVLDQFEQWLHAKGVQEQTELVQALRQCDGERVQCIVMVRDDFGMAATRFMAALDIPILQGQNFATVDLFDPLHARRILAEYGRAFGRLPDDFGTLTREQKAFLSQAVAGLAQEGKVISVRLALFAEMVKGKDWMPATLKEVGGMEGVGITFLEETFAAPYAPPQHRLHQKAARAVLKALLPETGTDIKGQMHSQQKLLEISGYADHPKDFEALLRILDAELRLITPTDPNGVDAESQQPQATAGGKFYQLTHDYLVPSLREWLTRKQKETRRGRAELRLAERAVSWSDKAENRHLPSWWEWADIRLFTRKRDWTAAQRKMMRRATRVHAGRGVVLAAGLLIATLVGLNIRAQFIERSNAKYAAGLVQQLLVAETAQVPVIVSEMENYRVWTDPLLQEAYGKAADGSPQKLHTSLALLPVDARQRDYLYERLLSAGANEVPVIRDALAPHQQELTDSLWTVVEQPTKGNDPQRLRAACALATYDPDSSQWEQVKQPIADDLVRVPAVHLATWMESLRPVRLKLLAPLAIIFRDGKRRESLATDILADYAADRPDDLADLLLDADEKQFAVLYPKLKEHADQGTKLLLAELDQQLQPMWKDPNLDPSWKEPDPALVRSIEEAQGLRAERFAFCQTMPLKDFLIVAEGLRQSGYRPIRFRPYATDKNVLVAAVWTRDDQEWLMAHGLSSQDVRKQDAKYRAQSFHPVDVTGYLADGKERYAALWVKVPAETLWTQMRVGLQWEQLQTGDAVLQKEGYWRATTTSLATTDGRVQYAAIWSKPAGREPPYESMHMVNYSGENYLADLQVDVQISRAAPSPSTKERCAQLLKDAEKALQAKPADADARFQRAMARFELGENEKANEDLCSIIQYPIKKSPSLYLVRAIIHARLGKGKEAKDDLAKFQEVDRDFSQKAYLEAVVSAHLGDEAEGMKRLENAIDSNAEQASFLYQAACAYSVASGVFAGKDVRIAEGFAKRAVELLEKAIASGYPPSLIDADLDPLRDHAGFQALLQAGKLERNYVAVWHPRGDLTSTQVHGHDPREHLARCRELVEHGYRPVSISAAEIRAKQPLVTASVWHRPVVPDEDKEHLAKRQVNAAVALLKMGQPEQVWPLLKHKPDSRVRSYLIHRLSSLAADPQPIVKRLVEEKELSARRALLLCLGEFGDKELPQVERQALIEKILDWYRTDADSGIHGSAAWLLQQWGQQGKLQQIDKELATGKVEGQRRWYVTGQFQTFAILRGDDFQMGSPRTEIGREGEEKDRREPLHKRRIGRTFAIATHEVTVEQFLQLRPKHGYSKQYAPSPNCPVNGITWYEAAEYCNRLSKKEKLAETEWCYETNEEGKFVRIAPDYLKRTGYRLPTEAEWEYACRAGSSTSRYYGETEALLEKYAWCTKNSLHRLRPVGNLKPNDWGLFDMLGNGLEWTQDHLYNYYPVNLGREDKLSEDREQHTEPGPERIMRGGSFSSVPLGVRSATRWNSSPMFHGHANGFRLARTFH